MVGCTYFSSLRVSSSLSISYLQEHVTNYPILSTIARDYLAVQGSSVPCEFVFSGAKEADTAQRRSMTPKVFSAIQIYRNSSRWERKKEAEENEEEMEAVKRRFDTEFDVIVEDWRKQQKGKEQEETLIVID
jgi:hypothetical protein